SAASVLAMLTGLLLHDSQMQSREAAVRQQKERAESQYREARDTLRQMLARASARNADGVPKLQELRREQQEDVLAFFLKMVEQQGDDPEVRFDIAQARYQAGLLQFTLGRPEEAAQNMWRAEADFAALVAAFPRQGLFRYHHAVTLKDLGAVGRLPPAEA